MLTAATKGIYQFSYATIFLFLLFPHSLQLNASVEEDSVKNSIHRVKVLIHKAANLLSSSPDSAFYYAKLAQELSEKDNHENLIGECYQIMGQVVYEKGVYSRSLDYHLKALHYFKICKDKINIGKCLNFLGKIYYDTKQLEPACKAHKDALELFEEIRNEEGKATTLGLLGHFYEKKGLYNEALEYQYKALLIYEKIANIRGKGEILENIGSIYEDLGNYSKAREYFTKALEFNKSIGAFSSMTVNLNNIGDTYRKTNNYPTAIEYTNQALELSQKHHFKDQLCSATRDLGKIYQAMGDFKKAYFYAEKSKLLYEEIYNSEVTGQLALFQTLYDIERKNNEIEILEKEQSLNNYMKIAGTTVILLLITLGFLIFNRQKFKIKKNNTLHKAQNELMQAELNNKKIQQVSLQNELEIRSKTLTAHTLHIIQKNRLLEDLREKLTSITSSENKNTKKELKNLILLIDKGFNQDKDWNDFRNVFEQVHNCFFEKLKQKQPDLSPSELRLAALIKLNLNSKDIATIMGISPDSLRISRYRLRKKLSLEKGENLPGYIQSVA